MALNLLHTRTLAQARQFLDRSFGNYLGAYVTYTAFVNHLVAV